MIRPVIKVHGITANFDGVYIHMTFPISFDAFNIIERDLHEKGIKVLNRGGGGTDRECTFSFGPFKDIESTKILIKEFQTKISELYWNEVKYVKEFNKLEGEYEINGC